MESCDENKRNPVRLTAAHHRALALLVGGPYGEASMIVHGPRDPAKLIVDGLATMTARRIRMARRLELER